MDKSALLAGHCSISPSGANIDIGTTVNSFVPTASWMSISGRLLHITIMCPNKFQPSCNSTIWPPLACVAGRIFLPWILFWWRGRHASRGSREGKFRNWLEYPLFSRLRRQNNSTSTLIPPATQARPALETFIFFPMVFHVWSFLFFIGDQRLMFPDLLRSFTKVSNSFWPISLFSKRSFSTLLGITTFVTTWKRPLFRSMKGFVKLWIVVITCSMFFSSREITGVDKVWWWVPSFARVVSATFFASWANQASSGAMRKKLVRAFGFRVTPTSPLRLSVSNLFPLKHGPHPKHKMAHADSC